MVLQTGDTERALELVEGLVKMIQPMPIPTCYWNSNLSRVTLSDSVSINSDLIYDLRNEDEARVEELNAINEGQRAN